MKMKLAKKIEGKLGLRGLKRVGKSEYRQAEVALTVQVTKGACAGVFGDELARIAFAAMEVDDGRVIHGWESIKLPRVSYGPHFVSFLEERFRSVPVIKSIKTIEHKAEIEVVMSLPVIYEVEDSDLLGEISTHIDDVIAFEFEAAQGDLIGD